MTKTLATIAAVMMIATGTSAQAESFDSAATTKVKFGDLNLQSAAGKATLNKRLKFAARQVCSQFERGSAKGVADFQNCVATSMQQANDRLAMNLGQQVASR